MERNGALAYSREFDERYGYDGKDLGAVCRDGRTVFKVWSPMAERVELRLYHSGPSKGRWNSRRASTGCTTIM